MSTSNLSYAKTAMTLAAAAALGSTQRPSGELCAQQQARILAGVSAALSGNETTAGWQVVWLGLTTDRANLSYIAQGPHHQLAVCLRGTVGGDPIDTLEDTSVGQLVPFNLPGCKGLIAQGAMVAFTEVTSATCQIPDHPLTGKTLVQALSALIRKETTLIVTGHSLGGALVTTVSLYLRGETKLPSARMRVFTFAAPTAGTQGFALHFDTVFPDAECYINQNDIVPYAWANIEGIKDLFPSPGPTANLDIKTIINNIAKDPREHVYTQPKQQPPLNPDYTHRRGPYGSTTAEFTAEVAYQHANDTYLSLLRAPPLGVAGPVVLGVSPAGAVVGEGIITMVTITGEGFTADSVVDFGTVPALSVVYGSATQLTAAAPPMVGTVDVRVTSEYGTSPATAGVKEQNPVDWFSSPPLPI